MQVQLPIQTFYNNVVLGLLRMVVDKDPNSGMMIRQTLRQQMPIIYRTHFDAEVERLNLSPEHRAEYDAEFDKALVIVMTEINSILDKVTATNKLSENTKGDTHGKASSGT